MIQVSIVEDQTVIREGLAILINGTEGLSCIHAHDRVESLMQVIQSPKPDVVLMDIQLPGMSGIDGVREVKRVAPDVVVLMLTVYEDNDKVFRALCAGACGYLVKRTPPAQILEALRDAHKGGAPMSSQIARKVVRLLQETKPKRVPANPLTDRERQILTGLADGNGYRAIGDVLHISVDTVRFHIRNIYQKLQVHTQSQAVAQAIRKHLID